MNEWLSVDETAKVLGVAYRTVHKLLNSGELTGYRIARNFKVRPSDIDAYLDSARIRPGELNHLIQHRVVELPARRMIG